ncbi:unnamed protein product [Adineta ricciae]|uniref:Uncharacterized protein n=1 Tax=Adineta ricciae TaxID=249248 RepID=A0A814K5P9_ADIRI|nr:unnamed protein product [Adineta ricciae]CAF1455431.1 unnamed protein product [Adineta ricciae]
MVIRTSIVYLHAKILNYNLFIPDEDDYDDEHDLSTSATNFVERQIYSTWVYVFLLTIFVYFLFFVTLINPQSRTVAVSNLTPSLFHQLQRQYGSTLSCACTTIAVPYQTFVSNTVSLHPVCSSGFVSQEWIEVFYLPLASLFPIVDIRTTAFSHFELLSALCSISNDTVLQSLADIDISQLISVQVLTEDNVQSEIAARIALVRTSAPSQTASFLKFLQVIYRSNTFASALETNAHVIVSDGAYVYTTEYPLAVNNIYNTDCARANLVGPAYFIAEANQYYEEHEKDWTGSYDYGALDSNTAATMEGFFGGCFALDAALASTLQCLYDVQCLNILRDYFSGFNESAFKSLDPLPSSIQENSSVSDLVANLFIDQWSTKINYSSYFEQCAPSLCTYSTTDPINFSYSVTLLLSLYGGLTAILRLVAPFLINIVVKLKRHSVKSVLNCGLWFKSVRHLTWWMKQLNLFKAAANRTVDDVRQQRITTRCYLFLFACSIVILVSFTSVTTQTVTVVASNPSLNRYKQLQMSNPSTLKCPCSNSTMPYSTFASLSASFHQLCSSNLVSEEWITMLTQSGYGVGADNIWFLNSGAFFGQLSILCQLANKTVYDNINAFLARTFATSYVLNEKDFNTQSNQAVHQLIESTVISFNRFIDATSLFFQVHQPLTEQGSNVVLNTSFDIYQDTDQEWTPISLRLRSFQKNYSDGETCECAHDISCYSQTEFLPDWINNFTYPGLNFSVQITDLTAPGVVYGCYTTNSVLLSTLQAFYTDTTHLEELVHCVRYILYNKTGTVPTLDVEPLVYNRSSSRFPPKSSLASIVKELMVEQWNVSFAFDRYYQTCAPTYCTYTAIARAKDSIGVLLTLISMIGGLSIALKLLTPLCINSTICVFKPKVKKRQEVRPKLCDRLRMAPKSLLQFIFDKLKNLNIFPARTFGSTRDRRTIKCLGQWATRLYIVLLAISLTILALHTIIQPQVLTKTYPKPSLRTYNTLINGHGKQLQCPCSAISSAYDRYLQIHAEFHQICSSVFVSDQWRLDLLANIMIDLSIYTIRDYRRFVSSHLQFLKGLCELSIQSVQQSVGEVLSSLLVTSELLSPGTFEERINRTIDHMKANVPTALNRLLYLLRITNHVNNIVSDYGTNYRYIGSRDGNQSETIAYTQPLIYDNNCSCGLNLSCTTDASFNETELVIIKGLKMGCTPSESLLASTLECFHNSSCIDLLKEMTNANENITDTNDSIPLNLTNSRFAVNTAVIDLVAELFVERWSIEMNYSSYFDQCSPMICSYTYTQQLNSISAVTYILGFFGGLTILFKWISPIIVSFVNKIYQWRQNKRQTRVEPIFNIQTTIVRINVKSNTISDSTTHAPKQS